MRAQRRWPYMRKVLLVLLILVSFGATAFATSFVLSETSEAVTHTRIETTFNPAVP